MSVMVGTIGLSPKMDANRVEERPVEINSPIPRTVEATPPSSPSQSRLLNKPSVTHGKNSLCALFVPPNCLENGNCASEDVVDRSSSSENLSPPKCCRSFSVVPVDNVRISPNSNLQHAKNKCQSISVLKSECDIDASENLVPEELSTLLPTVTDERNEAVSHIRANNSERRVDQSSECPALQAESLSSPKTQDNRTPLAGSKRTRKKPVLRIPDESDIPLLHTEPPETSQAEATVLQNHSEVHPNVDHSRNVVAVNANLSPTARFSGMFVQAHTSLPLHYMTINAARIGSSVPVISPQYLTVQPIKSRVLAHGGLDALNSNFISKAPDGSSSVEYGSTDGRNIKFLGRRFVMSNEELSRQKKDVPLYQPAVGYAVDGGRSGEGLPALVVTSEMGECIDTKDATDGGSRGSSEDEDNDGRGTWGSKLKFILACIGSCVGLGNFWRFPYLCYKSGGGAFLIPYTIMLFLCGIPLLLMEMAIGQYTRRGPVGALLELCPIFVGSAVGVVITSIIFCSYYNIIISWSIYYLTQSFRPTLPWVSPAANVTLQNCTANSSTQLYFDTVVLQKTSSIDEYGGLVWPLFGCVVVAWVIVYFSIWKSIKSSGMVVLVTATLPYAFILIFLVRAVTLDGAGTGLKFLFQPNWSKLLDVDVWIYAASQNFNSIGIGFGSMITFSSYNKFSNNLLSDVWIIALVNAGTSLLAGIIVFSTMGNIAHELGCSITDVITQGPGLAFVAYPQALAKMPYPHVFAIMFFFLLIILGIDSQFATVEVIVTSLQDAFSKQIKRTLRYHEILVLLVCFVCFLLGVPYLFEGGIHFFHLVDYYSSAISLMYLAFFEVAAIVWCYGADRLARNLREMTDKSPSLYFKYCWRFLAPVLLFAIAVMSWVDHKDLTYAKTSDDDSEAIPYPTWALIFGWGIACFSIVPIPLGAVYMIYKSPGDTFWKKVRKACQPMEEECPTCNRSKYNPDNPCRCQRGKRVQLSMKAKIPVPTSEQRPSVVTAFDQQPPDA